MPHNPNRYWTKRFGLNGDPAGGQVIQPRVESLAPAPLDPRVWRVEAFVRSNIQRSLRLEDMTALVGLSVSRLCHLFKSQTGVAPSRFLKVLRMRKAKELLETTTLSVKEITARVGINDVSHFVRDFETIYGLSPARYRLQFCRPPISEPGSQLNPLISSTKRQSF